MNQPTILVVDDSPSARLVTRRLLEGCGYRVEEADAAEVALRVIPSLRPDAVVMDNLMPGMDGLDAALELASSTLTSAIPVVLVSAGVDDSLERRALSFGVRAVVRKGDDPRRLCRLLDSLLAPQLGGLVRATLEQAAQRQARALEAGLVELLGGARVRPGDRSDAGRRAPH